MSKGLLIMSGLTLLITAAAWYRSPTLALEGAQSSLHTFLGVLPAMLMGILLGGMVQVLLPQHIITTYTGEESGLKGLVIGCVAGMFTPGGPFLAFPLVASLWKAGTGIGPLVSFLTAWSLLGFHRILMWEGPIMGWHFVAVRVFSGLLTPVALGWLAAWIYRLLR